MSLQVRNGISAPLARRAAAVRDKRPILQSMGASLESQTKRAFTDASLRPSPWAPLKKTGKPATLRRTGSLWQSIRVAPPTQNSVTVASDRPYAAIHQLGGQTRPMPARPFFPLLPNGKLTPDAQRKVEAIAKLKIEALTRP